MGGAAAVLSGVPSVGAAEAPLAGIGPAPVNAGEDYWWAVRAQFAMPPDVSVLNAANLCPSSLPVWRALEEQTRSVDRDPSMENRKGMLAGKEVTRRLLAEFFNVTPEEIVITRNTSEANNMVSQGLDLRRGDEVIVFGDNHPCNKAAWQARQQRYGFSIVEIPIVAPHPGAAHYIDVVRRALTPATRVLAFTHHTNTVGDLFPAKALCALAREHGVLTLVDGAQSFGLLPVDLRDMDADFYSGSAHKWLCGPKEVGVLYVAARSQARLWPTIVSSGNGAVGLSRTHEALGQRDEPAIVACGAAVAFQQRIGSAAIEARSRFLGQRLLAGLQRLNGVRLYTSPDPARSVCVVVVKPGDLDPAALAAALYRNERIGVTARTADRPGLRISPHFYNLTEEVDRTVEAIERYLTRGV